MFIADCSLFVVIWGLQKGVLDFTNDATNVDQFCVNGNLLDLGVIVNCFVRNDCSNYYTPQRPLLISKRFFTKIFKFFLPSIGIKPKTSKYLVWTKLLVSRVSRIGISLWLFIIIFYFMVLEN